ncbi:MAG: TonB-dependent receptor domain-containing protein, partial [Candidatus Kapaibacteriota bacterium]
MKKIYLLVGFLLIYNFTNLNLQCQEQKQQLNFQSGPIGVIRGKIVDDQTNTPMEYVSIRIARFRDSSIISGSLSDKKGYFEIKNIPYGRYFAIIKFIGFKTKTIDSIFITPRNPEINLGIIHFQPEPIKTNEIEVTAQKDIVTYAIDRRIYDVSKDLSTVGGSALDVLSNVPSVSVDIEGNISMRGSGNVQILIDGKPSSLLGFDRGTALEQIPADNIERIEVITNPSAKFDPDGVAGIINIILKKNTMLGYGAILNANIGTADKYNGSVNLNLRTDNFNSTLGYSVRAFSMRGNTEATRASFNPDSTFLMQNQNFLRRGNFQRIQFSSEWTPNSKNSLILNANLGFFGRKMADSTGYMLVVPKTSTTEDYFRKNNSNGKNLSYDLNIFYKYLFDKKDKEFTTNIMFMSFHGEDDNFYNEFHPEIPEKKFFLLKQNNKINYINDNFTMEMNFVNPLDFGKLDFGAKLNIRKIDIDYSFLSWDMIREIWLINDTSSNKFGYNENILASYLTYSGKLSNFGYQFGLRIEQTFTNSDQKTTNEQYKNNYFNLFPTIHLSYQVHPLSNLMLSYTRRINRPQSMFLNPFKDYSDPQNISQGNPYLKPEFANSFEISNLTYLGKNSFNLTIFYRYTTNIISRITRLDTSKQFTLTSYENLNQSKSLGFEAILNSSLFDFWKVNLNFSYFYLDINGIPLYGIPSRNSKSWNVKFNSVLNITRNIDLQLNLTYDSPTVTTGGGGMYWRYFQMGSVGKLDGIFTANLSAKFDFLDNRGSITFRLIDVFKTINYKQTTNGSNFVSSIYRTRESRIAFLGFTYKINDYKRPKIKRPE